MAGENCPAIVQNTQPCAITGRVCRLLGGAGAILPWVTQKTYDPAIMNEPNPIHSIHSPSRQQASILVVDPSPLSLIATAGVLDYQGYACVCARSKEAAVQGLTMTRQDLVVWDVANDAMEVLEALEEMRGQTDYENLPAVMIAESRWAGLEKKAEVAEAPTRCLFKPIDPNSLIAVVHQVLYMPTLLRAHRRKGSKPSRPGWVTL